MVRIVVIDDHDLVRSTLRRSLARHSDFEVLREAGSAEAGLEVVRATNPDLVIFDAAMSGMDRRRDDQEPERTGEPR